MLNSCLDIFEARIPSKTIGHDFGLLHALDERIAMYGWVTNTGYTSRGNLTTKFPVVIGEFGSSYVDPMVSQQHS